MAIVTDNQHDMMWKHWLYILVFSCFIIASYNSAWAATISHREISKTLEAIIVEGDIAPSDVDQFRSISLRYDNAVVLLNSPGGALLPAIEIGKMIRLTGYSTLVADGSQCTSSCALIWLAGSRRLKSPEGAVGFHASYMNNDGSLEETGVGNAVVGHYLSLLNLSQKAVIFATLAAPREMNWLTDENKSYAGIDFEDFLIKKTEDGSSKLGHEGNYPSAVSNKITPRNDGYSYTIEDVRSAIRSAMHDPKNIDGVVSSAKLDDISSNIFKDHLHKLYNNDQLIDKISDEFV